MKLEIDHLSSPSLIEAYGNKSFKINKVSYSGSIIITADNKIIKIGNKETLFSNTYVKSVLESDNSIDLLIFGTVKEIVDLPNKVYSDLVKKCINIDVMNTSAACRTWNILTSENRRTAAILKAVN